MGKNLVYMAIRFSVFLFLALLSAIITPQPDIVSSCKYRDAIQSAFDTIDLHILRTEIRMLHSDSEGDLCDKMLLAFFRNVTTPVDDALDQLRLAIDFSTRHNSPLVIRNVAYHPFFYNIDVTISPNSTTTSASWHMDSIRNLIYGD